MKNLFSLFLFLGFLTLGCVSVSDQHNPNNLNNTNQTIQTNQTNLKTFETLENYSNFVLSFSNNYNPYYSYRTFNLPIMEKGVESIGVDTVQSNDLDYSGTNVQVNGVDEGDILKTDGKYIYTISNKVLYIIKAYPGKDAKILSTTSFDSNFMPTGLFINNNTLIVFGYYNNRLNYETDLPIYTPYTPFSFVRFYDVSVKTMPSLKKEYKIQGSIVSSRMLNNSVYLILSNQLNIRPPYLLDGEKRIDMPINRIAYYPIPYSSPSLIEIYKFNTNKLNFTSKAFVVNNYPTVYMSKNNLYISYRQNIDPYKITSNILIEKAIPKLSNKEKDLIKRIDSLDPSILSNSEKLQKKLEIISNRLTLLSDNEFNEFTKQVKEEAEKQLQSYEYLEYTYINKISLNDLKSKGLAKAPGHLLNQFSLDEYNNTLRVALTLNAEYNVYREKKPMQNMVYTFDSNMDKLGSITNIAPEERIYSTRFIGNRLYMVTFRRVDPFFVIDLSHPSNPKILGKLKIPGYSTYLHPYDNETIIGIGKQTDQNGRQTSGLKISLFNVSDISSPKLLAEYVSKDKYSHSNALYEHKAFLFSRKKHLLVIPVYNYVYRDEENSYNGAFVFYIDKNNITLRALIDHSDQNHYYSPAVERSLYIDNLLYTKSQNLLRINNLEDMSSVKQIKLQSLPFPIV